MRAGLCCYCRGASCTPQCSHAPCRRALPLPRRAAVARACFLFLTPTLPVPFPPPPLPPGSDSSVPSTVEAQQNARNTSDLLRRFRELGERMRQEYKEPPVLGEQEARLRVRGRAVGGVGWGLGREAVAATSLQPLMAPPVAPAYLQLQEEQAGEAVHPERPAAASPLFFLAALHLTSAPPFLSRCLYVQERRAGVEEYAEKLAVASRRAEALVKEFEEMGAGDKRGGNKAACCPPPYLVLYVAVVALLQLLTLVLLLTLCIAAAACLLALSHSPPPPPPPVIGDLGLSLVKLGKFEEEEGGCGWCPPSWCVVWASCEHARGAGWEEHDMQQSLHRCCMRSCQRAVQGSRPPPALLPILPSSPPPVFDPPPQAPSAGDTPSSGWARQRWRRTRGAPGWRRCGTAGWRVRQTLNRWRLWSRCMMSWPCLRWVMHKGAKGWVPGAGAGESDAAALRLPCAHLGGPAPCRAPAMHGPCRRRWWRHCGSARRRC